MADNEPKTPKYDVNGRRRDNIKRGIKEPSYAGTATFFGLRALDPFLQHHILSTNAGSSLLTRLNLSTLPRGPPLLTNTPLDTLLGLSPYRTILFAMSLGSMLKQNLHLTLIMRETMPPVTGAFVSVFNSTMNSLNSLAFICAQTSASANGEHFPQTPLIVGSTMYVLGLGLELLSETQRHIFKKDERNRGKVYSGGLFGASRHVNYFGYMLWRSGYALAAGGWAWGAVVGGFFAWDFLARGIPVLQEYLEEKYGEQYAQYEKAVPYKFVPYLY